MVTAVRLFLLALAAGLVMATPASAKPIYGYGDQRTEMFSDGRWQSLPLKDVRRLVDWDTPSVGAKTAALDAWMGAAHATGARPLIAIDRSWTQSAKKKPSVKQYRALITWLKTRYPWWNTLTPWNEANFRLQPTYKNPGLAYKYWKTAKKACKGCTVTSPVVLAGAGTNSKWLGQFKKLSKGKVRLWAVHVYADQNRFTDKSLKAFEKQMPGQLWVTEAAGWVKFLDGKKWPYNEKRAAKAVKAVFRTAKKHKRVKRWYFYQWQGNSDPDYRWDSGIVNFDGTPRLGYHALVKGLQG